MGTILREGQPIVPQVWRADRPWSRLRGLLARPPLRGDAMQALWLTPCSGVHTFGMGYPLDVVVLDRGGRVLECRESLPPWRMWQRAGAWHTVEMAPGGIAALAPAAGEEWTWRES
ncbi:MAG: DUF192 domain-containing protein [Rhodanobacter sp.]